MAHMVTFVSNLKSCTLRNNHPGEHVVELKLFLAAFEQEFAEDTFLEAAKALRYARELLNKRNGNLVSAANIQTGTLSYDDFNQQKSVWLKGGGVQEASRGPLVKYFKQHVNIFAVLIAAVEDRQLTADRKAKLVCVLSSLRAHYRKITGVSFN